LTEYCADEKNTCIAKSRILDHLEVGEVFRVYFGPWQRDMQVEKCFRTPEDYKFEKICEDKSVINLDK